MYLQTSDKIRIMKSVCMNRCFHRCLSTTFHRPAILDYVPSVLRGRKPAVSVINLYGVIMPNTSGQKFGGKKYVNIESLDKTIEKAFAQHNLKEVCLSVNSMGGSPTQCDLITSKINRLADEKNITVTSFVEDHALSGGYWLACAGSQIYVTENSLLGSIGVIVATFGLDEFIKRYGISRRVHTAGENKDILDVFQPEKQDHKRIIKGFTAQIHENFKNHVITCRSGRIAKKNYNQLFNGEFFDGKTSIDLGLADGVDNLDCYLNKKYGKNVKVNRVNRVSGKFAGMFNANASLEQQLNELIVQNRLKMF